MMRISTRVLELRPLCPGTYELVIERHGFQFRAGEEIILHGRTGGEDRTYSLAGGENEPVLRILFRVIPEGLRSPQLARLKPGDQLAFSGPSGSFTLRDPGRPMWFIATGTGIAPALSLLRTHPDLTPVVLHGARHAVELYARAEIEPLCSAYHPCLSREGAAPRRVTDVLPHLDWPAHAHFYLCGSNTMIQQVHNLLRSRGVSGDAIFSEAYYFW